MEQSQGEGEGEGEGGVLRAIVLYLSPTARGVASCAVLVAEHRVRHTRWEDGAQGEGRDGGVRERKGGRTFDQKSHRPDRGGVPRLPLTLNTITPLER